MKKYILLIFTIILVTTIEFQVNAQSVGIGSSSFTPLNMLDVKGKMVIGSGYAGVNTAPADGLLIQGNTGIGTTNPGYKLDVNGNIGTNYTSLILNPNGGTVATDGTFGVYWHQASGTPSSDYGIYRTSGAWTASTYQQLRLQFVTGIQLGAGTGIGAGYDKSYVEIINGKGLMVTSGNVGIGTTSPGAKLHISAGDASLALYGPNASWGGKLYVGAAPNQAAALTAQVIATDGNLHLDPAPSKNMYLGYYQARDIYINPNGGNVGIGTTSPGAKLEINGQVKITGGSPGAGKILTSDASGLASWQKLDINSYPIPNTGGSSQWVKLGTLTIGQQGQSAFIRVVSSTGYNASIDQNFEVYIRFKTSNASSIDGNGFAGDGSYYITGRNNQFFTNGRIKFVSNAAGTGATSYDLYMYFGNYTGEASFYEVSTTGGTWVHSGTSAADPGAASSTVMIPTQEFNVAANSLVVNSAGNVGIGTASPNYKLDINGAMNCNDIVGQTFSGDKSIGTEPAVTWTQVRSITITKERNDTPIIINADFKGVTNSSYIVCAARIRRSGSTIGWNYGGAYNSGYSTGTSIVTYETGLAAGSYTYTLEYASTYSTHIGSTLIAFELKQ